MCSNISSVVRGIGGYLPSRVVTNDELSLTLDTSDEWIYRRTGIHSRHIAEPNEFTSDLAAEAGARALKNSGISPNEIDLLIVATVTPDKTFPSTAVIVQKKLNIKQGSAFDISVACNGFIQALSLTNALMKTNKSKKALIIGADTFSRILDWNDRTTCALFGDGAGAFVLCAEENSDIGIIDSYIQSDGEFYSLLMTDGGVSSTKTAGVVKMIGREVFKHAVEKMATSIEKILSANSLTISDIDLLVPHQANQRVIEAVANKVGFPMEKIISTLETHANTSAASIPLSLSEQMNLKRKTLLFTAIGAGFSWGSILIKF